ncbi:MAG: carboxypeptidase-like regulatory domain-containing protein [Bacteroidales bacterium]|nr:carboxypeptidase-like regulatory domain-containing protein [Bacteroidales bacterium]MBN2820211.1 carboxypeptidase-like regulatory domain-containing protein [Bacteroidales bacterium]
MKRVLLVIVVVSLSLATYAKGKEGKAKKAVVKTVALSGQVTDITTGEALAGVEVVINNHSVFTDFEGEFTVNNLQPGECTISTNYVAYKDQSLQIDLNRLEQESISIALETEK